MTQLDKREASDDEIQSSVLKIRSIIIKYALTMQAVYVEPQKLRQLNAHKDNIKPLLPPVQFFLISFVLATAIELVMWPKGPYEGVELPEVLVRFKAVLDVLPISVPIIAVLILFLSAIVPWPILRLASSKVTLKRLIYIYCYSLGGIILPIGSGLLVVLMSVAIISITTLDNFGELIILPFVVISAYSFVWTTKRIAESFDLKIYVVVVALLSSCMAFSLIDLYIPLDPIQAYRVSASAMVPTIQAHDRVFVNRWTYKWRRPSRGEIIAYYPNEDMALHDIAYLFRVVGVAGDELVYKEKVLYVNGQRITSETDGLETTEGQSNTKHSEKLGTSEYEVIHYPVPGLDIKLTVPPEHVFVMGDNRDMANDSRFLGSVPYTYIIGHAYYRFFPLGKAGKL